MTAHGSDVHASAAAEAIPAGRFLAPHYASMGAQLDTAKLGMWLFLVTEILFFGGLFCAFAVFRTWYFDGFVEAHHHLDKVMGALPKEALDSWVDRYV